MGGRTMLEVCRAQFAEVGESLGMAIASVLLGKPMPRTPLDAWYTTLDRGV